MNKLSDKDGLERDIAKLQNKWGPWRAAMKPHFLRFLKRPSFHNHTNLMTESSRADAYVNGHIMAIYFWLSFVLSTGLTIALVVK
jgi:hypothetical protein